MKQERWAAIQEREFAYHLAKDETRVLEINLPYWRSLIAQVPEEVRFEASTRVLDLGCGGCGILLGLDRGELVGVDPLMNRYLEKFPFLAERKDIRWIEGAAEEVTFDGPFDVVFAINSFDHVFDPRLVVGTIRDSLKPGGHCVMTLNCHNTRLFRAYYAALYRFVDHHHPHQFTPRDVERLFHDFTLIEQREIDELWFPHAERYARDVLRRPFVDRRKWLRAAANPLKWPMGLCKLLLNMPRHKTRPGQRSIFSNYLLVLRK